MIRNLESAYEPGTHGHRKYNNVVGVAGGPHKIEAIYAVLTGKYLDVLITDENTATAVLDLYQSKNNIDTERKDGALQ